MTFRDSSTNNNPSVIEIKPLTNGSVGYTKTSYNFQAPRQIKTSPSPVVKNLKATLRLFFSNFFCKFLKHLHQLMPITFNVSKTHLDF